MHRTGIYILVSILACNLLSSCKKDEKSKDPSSWYVDGDARTDKDGVIEITPGKISLSSHATNKPNSFRMSFALQTSLPTEGNFKLTATPVKADEASFDFWYNGTYYILSPGVSRKLVPRMINGKTQYVLDPCMFISYLNPNDSVEIKGTFMIP